MTTQQNERGDKELRRLAEQAFDATSHHDLFEYFCAIHMDKARLTARLEAMEKERERTEACVWDLYRHNVISRGKVGEILGLDVYQFLARRKELGVVQEEQSGE